MQHLHVDHENANNTYPIMQFSHLSLPEVEGLWDLVAKMFKNHCARKVCGVRNVAMNIGYMQTPTFKDQFPPRYCLQLNESKLRTYLRLADTAAVEPAPHCLGLPPPARRRQVQGTSSPVSLSESASVRSTGLVASMNGAGPSVVVRVPSYTFTMADPTLEGQSRVSPSMAGVRTPPPAYDALGRVDCTPAAAPH